MGRKPLCDVETPLLGTNKSAKGHLMKIEWLATDVTAVGSSDIAERAILGKILMGHLFGQFKPYLWSRRHFVV